MKKQLALIFVPLLLTACGLNQSKKETPNANSSSGSDTSTSTNAFFTTCASGDVDCYLQAFFMEENGSNAELVIITSDLPAGSAASMTAPSITSFDKTTFSFASSSDKQEISIYWSDPNGSQPAFCMRTCNPKVRCSSSALCRRSIPDGLVSGVWRTAMNYTAGPATQSTTEEMTVEFIPISMPSGEDPVALMEKTEDEQGAGSADFSTLGMSVGPTAAVTHQITAPAADTSGTTEDDSGEGGKGSSCVGQSQCGSGLACFSSRSCIPSVFSGNGCSCAGTSSPGQCLAAASCSNTGGNCGNGVNACCVGLTCVNGTCEGPGGRCP